MKLKYILYLCFTVISLASFSQTYNITWQRTIGGNKTEKLTKLINTADGGTVLCGYSNSQKSGDKLENSLNGKYDFWVVKLSATGATQWAKTYGGADRDLNPTIIQTADGGYLLGGSSISPATSIKSEDAINQSFDYWVIKLDKYGEKVWDNTIGGIQFEKLGALLETPSGYFALGSSNSTQGNDKTIDNEGTTLWPDYWVVKMNKSGTVLWDSVYGNTNRDAFTTAVLATDGGIVLGGTSYSPRGGNKKEDYIGNGDFWIIKIDSNGNRLWDRTLGGNLSDYLTSIDVVGNIGYVLVGYSNSPASGTKSENGRGSFDYWIIRTDKSGLPLWEKTYGGSGEDYATSVKFQSSKYFVGGYSNSGPSGDKTSKIYGGYDFWTLVLDKNGNLEEQSDWGGKGDDLLNYYNATGTNEYLLAGTSNSAKGILKSDNPVGNTGNPDYWIFKISPSGNLIQTTIKDSVLSESKAENIKSSLNMLITPNPVQNILHIDYNANNTQGISISVYSNNGKLIKQEILSQSNGSYTLDMTAQAAGVYYAVMQSGGSSVTQKFVKN